MTTTTPVLDIRNLTITYSTHRGVLRAASDVNFTINPGEVMGLVGESGSGKSTVAMAILDLLGEQIERVVVDLAPLACAPDPADHLLAAERFGYAAAFDHREYRGLHRGEPATALRAGPAPADGLPLIGFTGVDDPGIRVTAERTVHRRSFPTPTDNGLERLRAYLRRPRAAEGRTR